VDRTRVVLVLRAGLPAHQAVNAAAVLGTSAAHLLSGDVGAPGLDASGHRFAGITTIPVPVLVADRGELSTVYRSLSNLQQVTLIPFTEVARRARTYPEYLAVLADTHHAADDLVGVLIVGAASPVTKATRKLALLGAEDAGDEPSFG